MRRPPCIKKTTAKLYLAPQGRLQMYGCFFLASCYFFL